MISSMRPSWSILLQTVPGASRSLFLFTNFDPLADTDGDGWTDGTEAISGTAPLDRIAPQGIIPLQIIQTPAVYINGPNGDPEIFTPAAVSITWPTLVGKQYTLFASVDLTAGSWLAVDNDTPRIGTTAPMATPSLSASPTEAPRQPCSTA